MTGSLLLPRPRVLQLGAWPIFPGQRKVRGDALAGAGSAGIGLNDPAAFWRLENSTPPNTGGVPPASLWADEVGNAHPLVYPGNGYTLGVNTGKVGNAVVFAAAGALWLDTASYYSLLGNLNNTDWTIAGWLFPTASPGGGTEFCHWSASNNHSPDKRACYLTTFNNGSTTHLYLVWSSDGTTLHGLDTGVTLSLNTWYFHVTRYDHLSQTLTLDLDTTSSIVSASTVSFFFVTSGDVDSMKLWVGCQSRGSGVSIGRQDALGVWLRRLADSEVTILRNSGNGREYVSGSGWTS